MKKVKKLQGKIYRVMNEAQFNAQHNKVSRIHQLTFEVKGEEDAYFARLYHTECLIGSFDEENLGKPVEFTLTDYETVAQFKIKQEKTKK